MKIIKIEKCIECPFMECITHTCDFYHKHLSCYKNSYGDYVYTSDTKSNYCKVIQIEVIEKNE